MSLLLTRRQAAFKSGIEPPTFNYLVQQEPFSSYLVVDKKYEWLVKAEVIPLIKDYYTIHSESFHYYDSHQDFLIAYRVAPMLNIKNQELLTEIREGKWEGMYVAVPRLNSPTSRYEKNEKFTYFFIKEKLLQGRYNTIEQIGLNTTLVSNSTLQEYRKLGLLPQPLHLMGTNLYDEKEILELIPEIKLKLREQKSSNGTKQIQTAFDLLNTQQQQMISKYIRYRENGHVVEYNGYRSVHSIANKDVTIEIIKSIISSAFIVIICGRCSIEEDFHKNPFCRNEIPNAFNPNVFDIFSISKDDYSFLCSKRKGMTLIQIYHQLRTFYYFYLESLEEEALDDEEDFRKFTRLKRRIERFLQQFPRTKQDLKQADFEKRTKTFLTREQMIIIKQLILEDIKSMDPIKNATMWVLSCTTGVRPDEMHQLEINHFQLDSDGFIQQDEKGWGILSLPAEISKQENSPSHPDYHTPVPPEAVSQLNQYLARLYKRQGLQNSRGEGYLFRPDYALPFRKFKKPIRFTFINRIRERIDFTDDVRKHDFIFKASRHSLNNTIMRTFITSDPSLNEAKRTASDHQLRHKPAKSVGEEYYLSDISKEQYYKVLDETINFPWDREKLIEWEILKGYRNPPIPTKSEYDYEETEENKEINQRLLKLEEQLQIIKEKPQHLTEQQWIKERQKVIREKNMLLAKLEGVK